MCLLAKRHYRGQECELWKITKCLCSDGVRRTARITSEPDTFFSQPARVKVKGRTVTGFIMRNEAFDVSLAEHPDVEDWEFVANNFGKNGHLLPPY